MFVPSIAVENVQGILTEELEELFRQEDPGVTDLNMFAMSKEAFEAAEMTIGPPVAASGSDPTGDLAMGRQHLLLLWILTGQYATLPGVLTGGPSLDGLLNQLRTTPVVPSNATGIPTLEGHERAQLERFNFYKSGALVRLKGACENGANAFGISGGAEARINAGNPDQNFNELLNLSCQDEIQAVAKAAIRSALARIVANPGANILLLSTTRGEYQGPGGCFTGVPDPSQPPTAVTPENYRPKRCGGFEEFIASTAVRSVLDGLDPPVFLAEEIPIIIRFACLKVGGDLCRNQNDEPVGDPILDTDALANQFIAEAIGFIDMAVAATTNMYTPGADTRLVGAAPGGLPFLSRISAACQTVGFTITLGTPRGTLRECNFALVRKKIGTQQNPGVQQEAKKNLRVRALNLGSRAQEDLEVTLFEGDGVDPDTYDEQGSYVFDLEAGETRVLDVKSEPEDPGDPESPLKTKAIFPVTFDLLTLQPGVARALTFLLAPEGEGRRTVEADRLDNAAGLFYYVLDPANLTIPGTGPVPVSPDPDTSPHPLAVRRSRLELTMLIQGPGAATGGAKEATAGIYQAALLTYQVRNLGDTPLTNIEVVRGGQVVLTISQLGPNERQVQSEQFTPTQARLHNIMAVGTARDSDNNMVGPAIDSVLLYVSGDFQPFDVALFDASPLSAPTHPWSRVALHFDEQGQSVPVIGTVTDGDPEGGDGRLRIRIRRLTPGIPARISLEDGELAGVVDGIGRLEFEAGTATWITEPTVAEVIPQLDEVVIYYRPPPAFVREAHFEADAGWPASEFRKERNVRLVVTQTGIGAAQRLIKLRRPPVFLVHGLFAKRATWSDFQPLVPSAGIPATFTHVEGFDGRFDLFAVGNPGATGTFAEEAAAVRDQIGMSIRGYLRGFAIGKVDVVGHGVGGVLIRRLANTFSGNDADLSRVPFRKLVAIDAPLLGSRLASKINEINDQYLISKPQLNNPKDLLDVADILSSVTDTSEISPALKLEIKLETCAFMVQALGTTPRFFSGGAVIDLALGSAEILQLQAAGIRIPSHHLVGTTFVPELGIGLEVESLWGVLGEFCNLTPEANTAEATELFKTGVEIVKTLLPVLRKAKAPKRAATLVTLPPLKVSKKTKDTLDRLNAIIKAEKVAISQATSDPTPVFLSANDRIVEVESQLGGLPVTEPGGHRCCRSNRSHRGHRDAPHYGASVSGGSGVCAGPPDSRSQFRSDARRVVPRHSPARSRPLRSAIRQESTAMMTRAFLIALSLVGLMAGDVEALQFDMPISGTVVAPGQTLTVRVIASTGETVTRVAFATSERVFELPPGVFETTITIPLDAVGPEFVVAYATLADGLGAVASVELFASPGPLDALTVAVPTILSKIGELQAVEVTGRFRDGVVRDLSHPDRGTAYQTSNAAVLGVHPTGVLQARSRGTAQLIVTSHGLSRVVTVDVNVPNPPDNTIPVPDAGADAFVPSQSIVRLNGTASHDADGDPIVFRWTQETGPGVILRDAETPEPGFVAPLVTTPTVMEFSLFVVDSRGAQSFQDVVEITVQP